MATEIQIRGVPDDLKRRLKERAARERLTVSQYVIRLMIFVSTTQPTMLSTLPLPSLGATLVTCDGPLARAPAIAGLQIRNVTLLQ